MWGPSRFLFGFRKHGCRPRKAQASAKHTLSVSSPPSGRQPEIVSGAQTRERRLWYVVSGSRHRAHTTAGGKRRVAIPGVVVAGHPVQSPGDGSTSRIQPRMGSFDQVCETLAASRRVARLKNRATEMVRERTVVPGGHDSHRPFTNRKAVPGVQGAR